MDAGSRSVVSIDRCARFRAQALAMMSRTGLTGAARGQSGRFLDTPLRGDSV
jgi:hypothetical protein